MKKRHFSTLILVFVLLSIGRSASAATTVNSPYTQKAYSLPGDFTVSHGIEVSALDETIRWQKVKQSGISFAIIQAGASYCDTSEHAGYEIRQDAAFSSNIESVSEAGLEIGVMISSRANTREEAAKEAEFLLQQIRSYPVQLPLVIHPVYSEFSSNLTKEQRTQIILAFCEAVRNAGHTAALYDTESSLQKQYDITAISKQAQIISSSYTTPAKYSDEAMFWQYSGTGKVDGFSYYGQTMMLFRLVQTPKPKPEPTPQPTPKPEKPYVGFSDVSEDAWSAPAIRYVHTHGLMNGTSERTFSPSVRLSRAMVAQILYNFHDRPAVSVSPLFSDVSNKEWYAPAVTWAVKNGIMNGYGNGRFGPEDLITREQLVTVLYRFSKENGISVSRVASVSGYSDAHKISSYALVPMQWSVANQIVSGRSATELAPLDTASREECAQIFYKYFTGIGAPLMKK